MTNFVLLNDADRAPRWPVGVVGSISHTGSGTSGYCVAVAAASADLAGVGVDVEPAEPLDIELWDVVLTAAERRVVEGFDFCAQGHIVRTIFSAKECFYKAQYPLTRRFVEFHDVEVALDVPAGRFYLQEVGATKQGRPCGGRFTITERLIATVMAFPVAAEPV